MYQESEPIFMKRIEYIIKNQTGQVGLHKYESTWGTEFDFCGSTLDYNSKLEADLKISSSYMPN